MNILTFHLTLFRQGLPMALVVAVLWLIVFAAYRAYFITIFVSKAKLS